MTDQIEEYDDDDLAAAEYVMRVLPASEERAFEQRIANDRVLEAKVARWVERLSPIAEEVEPVTPRRKTKTKLMSTLFEETSESARIWDRLGLWKAISLVATGVAAVLAILLLLPPLTFDGTAPGSDSIFVSEIVAEDNTLRLLAAFDPASGTLQITRTTGAAMEGRVLELWAIEGDNPPVSLGVLAEAERDQLAVPEALRPVIGNLVLAISDEPPGGSPTGAPTGAVLAIGPLVEI